MGIFNRIIASTLPLAPRRLVWRFARRYIAGWTLQEAVEVVKGLQKQGVCATFDVLGENVSQIEECDAHGAEALQVIDAIRENDLDATLSVKLTQLGLHLAPEKCREIMQALLERANGLFVRMDMEDSTCTTKTLELFRELRQEHSNVGVVLQAYLRRTLDDIEQISDLGPNVRLCKGIYVEPEEIAFRGHEEVQGQFKRCLESHLDHGQFVGIATHDPDLIAHAEREISRRKLSREQYEFQMLLGVAEKLRRELIGRGHRLRVYIPFGRDWYAYATRRLKENPAIVGHVVANIFR